jgi:hypothetical protein
MFMGGARRNSASFTLWLESGCVHGGSLWDAALVLKFEIFRPAWDLEQSGSIEKLLRAARLWFTRIGLAADLVEA